MVDQDHDGSNYKGLIVNFLGHLFPSLLVLVLKLEGFLQVIYTLHHMYAFLQRDTQIDKYL
jgi:hypothetical protein